jgi:hypothetical protein
VVLGPAEAEQRSTGGSNARFGPVFDQPGTTGPGPGPAGSGPRNGLVISGHADLARSVASALARCGLTAVDMTGRPLAGRSSPDQPGDLPAGFAAAQAAVERAAEVAGGLDAVVIAPGRFAAPGPAAASWPELVAGYPAVAGQVACHAGWLQAAARYAVRTSRPVRVVHLADATSPPFGAAAQAVAQLARCASLVRPGLIDVFSIAVETAGQDDLRPVADLAARLLWSGDAGALRGAELLARRGWIGLRSHPGPAATASYGTSAIPPWIGDWLREAAPLAGRRP